jgi:hypothetical protein
MVESFLCMNMAVFAYTVQEFYMIHDPCIFGMYIIMVIEKNEMGRACGASGGGERCAQGFGGVARGKETIGETQT